MKTYEYGSKDASLTLIQLVDDHDLEGIENEARLIQEAVDIPFHLIAVKVQDWNKDLSPWPAPAVFGDEPFGAGAEATLSQIIALCEDPQKQYIIGGYSLAGLFALWASVQTERFAGVAAASPSVWFPGFVEYMQENDCKASSVYLSLGDREEKTRNPVMATVGDHIRACHQLLIGQGVESTLEWNQGNHFKEPDVRMARAFAWTIRQGRNESNQ